MTYAEERAAQLARLDAYMREHPPAPEASSGPDLEPDLDDPAESWTRVGCWPPAPMGARR